MARNNLFLTALTIGVAASACAAGGGKKLQTEASQARELLFKTLDRNYKNNVVAIISQRSPEDNGSYQQIQVQISKDGRVRQTVVYPLSMQGIEKIDDGKQSATILPDDKVILVQESPRTLPDDSETRINLTTRNYGLTLGGTTTVAGHRASIVIAKPRYAGLQSKRYHIDANSGFVLKLETLDSKGTATVAFEAKKVTYPASIGTSAFNLDLDKRDGFEIVTQRRTGFLDSSGKGYVAVGFTPVFPQELPFGFDIQDAQINDSGNHRSLAIRITDGPVKGTVYQYSLATARRMKAMPGTTIGDGSGIRFVVAADVPEAVRKKILNTFIEAARKAESERPAMGLFWGLELLPDEGTLSAAEELTLEIRQFVLSFGESI